MKKTLLLFTLLLLMLSLISCDSPDANTTTAKNNNENSNDIKNNIEGSTIDNVIEPTLKEPEIHEHLYSQKNIADTYLKSAATCSEGLTYYYSCLCGEKSNDYFTIGEPLGHSFSEWEILKEATYTEEGVKRRTCSVCGTSEENIIEKPKLENKIEVPDVHKDLYTVDENNPASITINDAKIAKISGNIRAEDQIDEYKFIPPLNGIYGFSFLEMADHARTRFNLLNESGYQLTGTDVWGEISTNATLYANNVYTLKMKQYKHFTYYVIMIWLQKPTIDISKYTTINDRIQFSGQTNNYEFTASNSSTYVFSITDNYNHFSPDIRILNSSSEEVSIKHDPKGIHKYVNLTAGETYLVQLSETSRGAYTLSINTEK